MKTKTNERLKEIRVLAGLKSGQVANLCGLTPANYSHFETGRNQLSLETAVKICEALKPFVGDRFTYLALGTEQVKKQNEEGVIHRDTAMLAFRDIIADAQRLGLINISGVAADEMARQFSAKIGKEAYPELNDGSSSGN